MWKDFGARINEMKKVNQFEKKNFFVSQIISRILNSKFLEFKGFKKD